MKPTSPPAVIIGIALLAGSALAQAGVSENKLLNVNFGTDAGAVKTGPAAIGQPGDLWNLYSRDDGAGGFRPFGELNNLKWSDGSPSPIHLTVTNAPGAWPSELADPMMALWLYPLPNGNGDIRLWLQQVPAGHYDLYLYGHGNLDDLVGVFEVTALDQGLGTRSVAAGPGWRTEALQENVHYVVFRDVPSDGTRPVVVTVKPSPHGEAVLNGLQLMQKNSLPPPPMGQLLVVPNHFASREDDGYSGSLGTALRQQCVYGADQFGGKPLLIKGVRYRRDGSVGPVSAGTIDVTIRLSTSPKPADGLSAAFEENLGSDSLVVLSGSVTIESATASVPEGPQAFDIVLPFATPFRYDPTKGNLLYEIVTRTPSLIPWVDASNDLDDGASRVFSFNPNATIAETVDTGADILGFVIEDITPPDKTEVILPPEFANKEDDGYTGPLGTQMRLQNVYSATHFPGPITIHEIRYRRDGSLGPIPPSQIDLRIRLSTTSRNADHLSANFEENFGPDVTVVLDGAVVVSSLSPGIPGGPQPFEIILPLTTPFPYHPAKGNLLIEITTRTPSLVEWTDGSNNSNDGASRVFAYGSDATYATSVDTGADIILLSATPIPPPPLEITPAGGYFSGTVEVALTSRVEGGAVRFTLDGTEPTPNATLYSQPFTLNASTRVLARVFKDGAPAADVVGALFLESHWNDGIPAAWRERYFGGNWFTQPAALALADADNDGATTVQEWLAGTNPADTASKPASPVALLTMTPAGGEFDLAAEVRLETPVPGGQIHYTTDGSEPGATSPVAEAVVTLTRSVTLQARVFVNGNAVSAVASGAFTVREIAPRITRQPASRTVLAGGSVSFEVEATGTPPLTYQWAFNGTDMLEADGRMLVFTSVGPEQAGTYTVRVSNALGSVVSEPATLTVHQRPQIVRQPEPVTVVVGQSATLSVEAVGDAPLDYVWFRNGMRILAAPNTPVYTIAAATPADAGQYQVRVSNPYGGTASRLVSLTVLPAPVEPAIATQPESLIRAEGESAVLTVTATGTPPLAYQWFFNGQPLAGAAEPRVEFASLKLADAGTYWVQVSNAAGLVTSTPAVLEVHSKQRGGTVVFANRVTITDLDAPVYDADGTTRLAGAAFFAQLYAGPAADQLAPVGWPVPFDEGTRAGYVPSSVVTITTVAPGAPAWVQMRAWESARGPGYEAARQAGGKVGASKLVQVTTGGAGDPPSFPVALVGLESFRLLREAEPPVITLTSPGAGATADDRFALAGTVTDNAAVALVQWDWNNQAMGVLPLVEGRFQLPGLRLVRGENRLRVIATDTAGNAAEFTVLVVYEPARVLALSSPAPVQEGRRLATDVTLTSPGGVSGLTFALRYDAERFRDPEFAWKEAEALAGALTQVNAGTPGEVRATLSLPGGELPAGALALGTLTLRARSVPEALATDLVPDLLDITDRAGAKIEFGNAAEMTVARILPRRLRGDNNANDALDVGDATLMQRLLTQLDPLRSWDHAANDLNASGDLDSGDVTKVLRVVVGLDPAPTPAGPARTQPARRAPSLAAAESAAAVLLTADRSQVWPGEVVKLQVSLVQPPAGVSGVSFRLAYPAGALRLLGDAVKTGPAVPAGVSSLLHVDEAAGQVNFAVSGTITWSEAGAVVLEVPFEVLPAGGQPVWTVSLVSGQVAWDNGYEVRALAPASLELRSPAPELASEVEFTSEGVRLAFGTAPGLRYTVEASDDLKTWAPLGTVDGIGQVAGFIDTDRQERAVRFYRVSVAR